jgi:hypothetical protein
MVFTLRSRVIVMNQTPQGEKSISPWRKAVILRKEVGNWIPYLILPDLTDFSVLIRDDDATGNTLYIDHVRITVFYTPSGGGGDTSYTRRRKLSLED